MVWHVAADMNNFGIWGGKVKSRVLGAGMGLDRSPCRQQEAVQDPAAVTPGLCWEVLLRSRKPSAPVSYGLSRQDDVPELGFAPSPGLEAP